MPDEAITRTELIDPALRKAGWDVNDPDQVRVEIPVDGFDPLAWQQLEQQLHQIHIALHYKRLYSQRLGTLRQAEHFFQSLLARAFEGGLS